MHIAKLAPISIGLLLALASPASATPLASGTDETLPSLVVMDNEPAGGMLDRIHALMPGAVEVAAACCKRCKKGKACGDSCISRDKSCHKGAGCACD